MSSQTAIPTTMRAARFYNHHDIRVEDVPVPTPREGQVLVEIEWCGICGSDLHEYIMGPTMMPTTDVANKMTGQHLPLTMGHEFCGRIVSEPTSSRLKKGMGVVVDPRFLCNHCRPCQTGKSQGCEAFAFAGVHGDGGLAGYIAVNESQLLVVPDNVPLDRAALAEPLTVAMHALKITGIQDFADKDVLIVGGGPVGIAMIYVLRAYGVKRILVSEPTKTRREQTSKMVEAVIDPRTENVGDRCREMTGGKGVDIVYDCAGIQAGLDGAADALGHSGIIINVSIWEKPMVVPFVSFLKKELSLKICLGYTSEDWQEVLSLLAKDKFPGYENLITSRIGLEDVVSKGFEELVERKDDHIKILISPKLR